ncbi:MAG: hypothetical protein LBL80_05260 [Ruminococcus sp.]|jgi:hypothetical protein|nr:hypothetical protein [Ruminococcus sp.]
MKKKRDKDTDSVEAAILRRALGYTIQEITLSPDPDSGDCSKPAKIVQKDIAPNVQAALIWLKTFRPEIWAKSTPTDDTNDPTALYQALSEAGDTLGGEEQ